MTAQSNFFDQPGQQVILNAPAAERPRRRLFYYDGQFFSDPGPEYAVAQVMAELSRTYPELANGTWHSRVINDHGEEVEEITFVKVTGEKGGLTARQVAACLLTGLQPAQLQAIALTNRLSSQIAAGQLDAYPLLELSPEIEAALGEAERVAAHSQGMVQRCLALTPTPLTRVPLGF